MMDIFAVVVKCEKIVENEIKIDGWTRQAIFHIAVIWLSGTSQKHFLTVVRSWEKFVTLLMHFEVIEGKCLILLERWVWCKHSPFSFPIFFSFILNLLWIFHFSFFVYFGFFYWKLIWKSISKPLHHCQSSLIKKQSSRCVLYKRCS